MKPSRLLSLFLFSATSMTYAASLTWDADTATPAAQDGAGVWNTTNLNWAGASGNQSFVAGDDVAFGVAAGSTPFTVTLASSTNTGALLFTNTNSYPQYTLDLGGNTLTVGGLLTLNSQVASNYTAFTNGTLALRRTSTTEAAPDIIFDPGDGADYGVAIASITDVGSGSRYVRGFPQRNDLERYSGDLRFDGPIVGSANVFLSGGAVDSSHNMHFVFNAGNSGFTGGVTLNANADLALTKPGALSAANSLTFAPGTARASLFLYGQSITIGSLSDTGTGTRWIRNGSKNAANGSTGTSANQVPLGVNADSILTITQTVDGNFGGNISDGPNDNAAGSTGTYRTLGLVKEGPGTLTLSGANSYTGPTTVNSGILDITGSLPTTSALAIMGGKFKIGYAISPAGTLTTPSVTQSGGDLGVDFSAADHASLVVNGDYTHTAGGLVVNLASSPVAGVSYPLVSYTGALTGQPVPSFAGIAGTRISPGVVNYGSGSNSAITVTFNTVSANVVWTGEVGNTWDTSTQNWANAGVPDLYYHLDKVLFDDTPVSGNTSPIMNSLLQPSAVVFNNSSKTYTISGTGGITGPGTISKQGTGTAVLATNNINTGKTVITGGVLQIGDGGTTGALGPNVVENAGNLTLNRSDAVTLGNNVSGTGSLTKLGGGLLTLNGTNTYEGGTTLAGGALSVNSGARLGTGPLKVTRTADGNVLTVANNSAVTIANNIELPAPEAAANYNFIKNSASTTGGTALTLSGNISGGSASATLFLNSSVMNDNTTTFVLSGNNTFTGRVTMNRGSLVLTGPTSLGAPGNLLFHDTYNHPTLGDIRMVGSFTLPNPIQLSFADHTISVGGTDAVTLSGSITQNGGTARGLGKIGTGKLTLSNPVNSYAGATKVTAGTLAVDGALTAGTAAVTVDAAATLSGTGSLNRPLVVNGTLAPGNGVGALAVASTVTFGAGSKYAFQVANWNGTGGTGYDQATTTGVTVSATTDSKFTVNVDGSLLTNFSDVTRSFVLATGPVTGLTADNWQVTTTNFSGAGSWTLQSSGGQLTLVYLQGAPSAYDLWAQSFPNLPAELRAAELDADGDGVPNFLEFVLNGDPSSGNHNPNAPTTKRVGDNLVFTFTRRDDSESLTTQIVQYGSNLTGWTDVVIGSTSGGMVTIDETDPVTDLVTVTIPIPVGASQFFARLKVIKP